MLVSCLPTWLTENESSVPATALRGCHLAEATLIGPIVKPQECSVAAAVTTFLLFFAICAQRAIMPPSGFVAEEP